MTQDDVLFGYRLQLGIPLRRAAFVDHPNVTGGGVIGISITASG